MIVRNSYYISERKIKPPLFQNIYAILPEIIRITHSHSLDMKKSQFHSTGRWLFSALCATLSACSAPTGPDTPAPDICATLMARADSLIDIEPDSTLVLCRQFFENYPSQSDSLYARARLIEGNAYFSLGDLEEARRAMTEARTVARKCQDRRILINATTDLGVTMRVSQQPDSALALYTEALTFIPDNGYDEEKAHLLTSIAILYANTGHLDRAREYADRAVAIARACGDMEMMMYATSQAGAIYNILGNKAKAYELTRSAMTEARRLGLPRYQLKALGHLLDLHLKDNHTDSVSYYLRQGEELARRFPENSVEGLGFLEEKYVVLAAIGRYRESLEVQRHLLGLTPEAAAFMPTDKLWLRMARNYAALHRPDSAYRCYERAQELTDSLRGQDADRQLSEFYARFKTSEKELALANLKQQQARSRLWLTVWVAVALLFAAACFVTLLYLRVRRRKEAIRLLQSRLSGIEQERGRLAKELHDGVCNDLYGIELLLQSSTPHNQLLTYVERIRSDVRCISHELMPPALQDIGLPQALGDMVAQLRHTYLQTTFSLSSDPATDWNAVASHITYGLYRICQELTGNILRHTRPTLVSLQLEGSDSYLRLTLSHDGETPDTPRGRGIGLASVNERLTALGATAEGLPCGRKITITCGFC